jgi:hypothetical protein
VIVRGVVDGIPTGARGAAFESNELRNEPTRTRKDNSARVKQRQYIPIKIALALVRRAVRDAVLTETFSGEFAGIFVASYQCNAVPLQDVRKIFGHPMMHGAVIGWFEIPQRSTSSSTSRCDIVPSVP